MISLSTLSLLSGGVFLVLYLAYRALLPKPLPGIPYNKDAANKLFGDVPEVMSYVKSTKQIYVRTYLLLMTTSLISHQTSPDAPG